MQDQSIQLVQVTKQYQVAAGDQVDILRHINLTIDQGEYIGLLGNNGSGKSTLAKLLNGLIQPTTGKVLVHGLDTGNPQNLLEIRRLVGMVFQNPDNQIITPVVEEEIAFGLENLGLPLGEIKNRINWALATFGLADKRHHAPHLLSGGQKQRLALAAVMAMHPRYLVLDEPATMLDAHGRRDLLQELATINRRDKITIILISHDPEDFIHARRLLVLDQGEIQLQGAPAQVFAHAELTRIGFHTPPVYQLKQLLHQGGYAVGDHIQSISELVDDLCAKL